MSRKPRRPRYSSRKSVHDRNKWWTVNTDLYTSDAKVVSGPRAGKVIRKKKAKQRMDPSVRRAISKARRLAEKYGWDGGESSLEYIIRAGLWSPPKGCATRKDMWEAFADMPKGWRP